MISLEGRNVWDLKRVHDIALTVLKKKALKWSNIVIELI